MADTPVTLSLCIIVGPKEAFELERVLKSCQGPLFDEIVVTVTSDDAEVKAVAEKYATKVPYFKWVHDFSAARNYGFSKATSDFIFWCFHPDNRVWTDRGMVPISQVRVGDGVLTHSGVFKPVTKTYIQDYDGQMCRIKGKMGERDILATPNHEFYSEKANKCRTVVKFCKPDCSKQWSKRYLEKYGCLSRQCKQGYKEYDYSFKQAGDLGVGDILSFPRLKQSRMEPLFLDLPTNRKGRAILPDRVEVTPQLMRLFGYFVAEGTTNTRIGTIGFCFNLKEEVYQQDVLFLMRDVFGLEGVLRTNPDANACVVSYSSVVLADFLFKTFNGLQPNRRIPYEFMTLGDNHLVEFLKAYYRGDGGENPDSFATTTASYELMHQVRLLLSRFGIYGEILPYTKKKAWKLRVGGKQMKLFEGVVEELHDKKTPHSFNKFFYSDSSYLHYPIESKSMEYYKGPVYNLEVEGDHTYVVEYALCHNCDSDDVIKPSEYQKLIELKPKLDQWDMVLCNYVYTHDDKDVAVMVLPRERIVRRCDYIKWHDPIHEYLNMNLPPEKICRTQINIDHYRIRPFDPQRNLTILAEEYKKPTCSPRTKFYYGKELCDVGEMDKAIPILEDYLKKEGDFVDNMCVACIRLAKYYFDKKEYGTAKNWSFRGVRYNPIYAENYVTIGTISEVEGDQNAAISYYKEALKKKLEGGMSQMVDFYGYIPAIKLAFIYYNKKDYENAQKYAELGLKHKPDSLQAQELLKALSGEMERNKLGATLNPENEARVKKAMVDLGFVADVTRNTGDLAEITLRRNMAPSVAWLIPVLDLSNPSIRLRRYNVSEKMNKLGIPSKMLVGYYGKSVFQVRNEIDTANVVVFTQYSQFDLELMKYLKTLGIKIVFDHCEALFGYPFENECMNEADIISCCSTKLAEVTAQRGFKRVVVLKDAIEEKEAIIQRVYEDRYPRPKAGYFGMGGNVWTVKEHLKDAIDRAGYDIVASTEWADADIPWSADTWPDDMSKCDVILCPQRTEVQPAKSNVKITTAMALGMPVIGSPIQSYKEVVVQGENGFLAEAQGEWYDALAMLKDPALRKKVGEAAKASVGAYSLENITKEWGSTLTDLINGRLKYEVSAPAPVSQEKEKVLVDIIIASYNNVDYLKLAVSSILLNTDWPYHIIISDGGSGKETWEYLRTLRGITVLGEEGKRMSFSETCNAGIQASHQKYFIILNSDVVVSKGWLGALVNKMDTVDRLAACGVLSNCDRGWLHDAPGKPDIPMMLPTSGLQLRPGMKMEEIRPKLDELYAFMNKSNETYSGKFEKLPWIAAYAMIFARCAVDEVGLFDPQYKNGCEDLDLCIRLSNFGYVMGRALDSFVFHFGGISRSSHQRDLEGA